LIQTVGSTFCMYAGKTIHNIDGRRKCKHKVQLLCQVNIEHLRHALACAALVQSSAWEVASRMPDDAISAVHVSDLVTTSKPTKSTKGGASSGASAGRGRRLGSQRRSRSQGRSSHGQGNQRAKKHGPSAHGTQHNGAPPANRFYFEKHVYVGIPRESDMVALKATQRFSSVKPLMVGIPVIGGPPVSTPSSSAMKRARVYLGTNLSEPHDKVIIKVQPGKHGRREADVLRRVNATPATRSVKLLAHLELAGDDDALVLARAPHEFAARTVTGLKQFQDLCQAVQAWHEAGVLHLDIKPSNVAVDAAGEVVVLDAGHSRILETGSTTCRVSCGHGTRGFTPPELEDTGSGIAGPWCDVFSLGKTLDWMLKHRRCIDRTGSLRDLVACMTSPNPDSRPTLKEVANVLGRTPSSPVLGDGVAGAVAPASKGAPPPAVVHSLSDVVPPTSTWLRSDVRRPVSALPRVATLDAVD